MAFPELHFFQANDVNGDVNGTLLEVPVNTDYFEQLSVRPALHELGYLKFRFSRPVGFAIFDSGAFQPETFVRLLIPDFAGDRYVWGGFLDDRVQGLIARIKAGEDFFIGGIGPKYYLDRAVLFPTQYTGTGWNIDRANGVFRWNETATAGRILNRIIDEAHANTIVDTLPDLSTSFGDALDSNGDAWANDVAGDGEFEVPIGQSYLETLFQLEKDSDLETTMFLGTTGNPQLRLDAWQSYGRDLTAASVTDFGSGVVHFKEAVNIVGDLQVRGVARRKASHVVVHGLEGAYVVEERSSYDPGEYAKAVGLESGLQTKNQTVLGRIGRRFINHQDAGEQEISVSHRPGDDEDAGFYFPSMAEGTGHYWIGDTVSLTTGGDSGGSWTPLDYRNEPQRVMAITMDLAKVVKDGSVEESALSWNLVAELNVERDSDAGPSAAAAGGTCNCPKLCHPATVGGAEVVTPLYNFNANGDGGDTLNWTGLLANQGPPGAAGTTSYYFKSSAPTEWADVLAVSAGTVIRVSGYVGLTAGEVLKWGWFNSGIGTAGNNGNLIGTSVPLATGPAAAWTTFTTDITAPVGTVGFALGRTSGPTFDEIAISTVVAATGVTSGVLNGEDALAARCDHQHHWLSESAPTVDDDETLDYMVGTIWYQVDDIDAPTSITGSWVLLDASAGAAVWESLASGSGAPTTADYLVGTAQGGLSAEIVVGTTPGGELGGTWASPTVDATHSGSAHHTESHQSRHNEAGADELKLDDLGIPDDNTDLDSTTSAHGLLRKLDNSAAHFLDGQGNWTSPAGGGGGAGNVVATPSGSLVTIPGLALGDRKPSSPGTYDEEFDGTADTLPTDWAWTSAPSGSDSWTLNSRWPSLLMVEGTGNTSYLLTRSNFTAAATFGIWFKVHVGPFGTADAADLRAYAFNSGLTEGRCVQYRATGSRAAGVRALRTISSAETVWGTEKTTMEAGGSVMYMGFVRTSNNFEAWYSRDGISWDQLAGSQSHTFTIDRLRFSIRTHTLSSTVALDWVRYRTDTAFPRP